MNDSIFSRIKEILCYLPVYLFSPFLHIFDDVLSSLQVSSISLIFSSGNPTLSTIYGFNRVRRFFVIVSMDVNLSIRVGSRRPIYGNIEGFYPNGRFLKVSDRVSTSILFLFLFSLKLIGNQFFVKG
jgi:hypothetical protein